MRFAKMSSVGSGQQRSLFASRSCLFGRSRIAVVSVGVVGLLGSDLGAAPPAGGFVKWLPEVSIDPPTSESCGWGQQLTSGESGVPFSWTEPDSDPLTSGWATVTGSGANLTMKAGVSLWCPWQLDACAAWCPSLSTPNLAASGWLKAEVQPIAGETQGTPIVFECDVSGDVFVKGRLDPENVCWWWDGGAVVSAGLKVKVTGSIAANWGPTLVFRVDGSAVEGSTTVTVGAGGSGGSGSGGEEGEVEVNVGYSWQSAIPFLYEYNDTFAGRWQWCGNPSGHWVKLTTNFVGSASGIYGGDASFELEVKNATVAFSYSQCECPSAGPGLVPLQEDPLG